MAINDSFYLSQTPDNQSCLLALRHIIKDMGLSEVKKYGSPCFLKGKKMICYLWIEKKKQWPYILFVDGNKIDSPLLEQGDRKRMKIFLVNPHEDIPAESIRTLIEEAMNL